METWNNDYPKPEPITLPIEDYRLPIYEAWDKRGLKCPHNPNGWVALHKQLLLEKAMQNA